MHTIDPTPGQFKAAKEKIALDTPIMMLNMLRFRENADYTADANVAACSGIDAYQRYSDASFPQIQKVGGKVLWHSNALASMIAPADEHWDRIFMVSWPTFGVFLDVIMSEEYQQGTFHRTAALQDSRLIMLERSE